MLVVEQSAVFVTNLLWLLWSLFLTLYSVSQLADSVRKKTLNNSAAQQLQDLSQESNGLGSTHDHRRKRIKSAGTIKDGGGSALADPFDQHCYPLQLSKTMLLWWLQISGSIRYSSSLTAGDQPHISSYSFCIDRG